MTHRATFFPTRGNEVRNASHSASPISRNGDRDSRPNRATMRSQIARIALDFWRWRPPGSSGFAMYRAGASASAPNVGNSRRSAEYVPR